MLSRTPPNRSVDPTLSLRYASEDYALGTFGPHILAVWRHEISLPGVTQWGRLLAELRASQPVRSIAGLSLVEPTCRFPAAPGVADASMEVLKRHGEVLAGFTMVYGASGFTSAGLRGQVTSVMTHSKAEVPYLVAAGLAEAVAWLQEKLRGLSLPSSTSWIDAIERLRSARSSTSVP